MIIGKFARSHGLLRGFALLTSGEINFSFKPMRSADPKGPNYSLVSTTGCEFGAAWDKTAEDGRGYLSVKLDSPTLPAPISCALFENGDPDCFNLVWKRNSDGIKSRKDIS